LRFTDESQVLALVRAKQVRRIVSSLAFKD